MHGEYVFSIIATPPRCHRTWRRSTAAKFAGEALALAGAASRRRCPILAAPPIVRAGMSPIRPAARTRPRFGVNLCTQRRPGELVDSHRRCRLSEACWGTTRPSRGRASWSAATRVRTRARPSRPTRSPHSGVDAVLFSIAGLTGGKGYVELPRKATGGRATSWPSATRVSGFCCSHRNMRGRGRAAARPGGGHRRRGDDAAGGASR